MDLDSLKQRIDSLLLLEKERGQGNDISLASEIMSGTLSIMSAVYGSESHQVEALRDLGVQVRRKSEKPVHLEDNSSSLIEAASGALRNLKEELNSGLTGSLQKRFTSDVLTDLITLAKTVLAEPGDNAKNVAAVLTAAAFEDTIRRMGSTIAGVMGKNDLSSVIDELRKKGTLVPPQIGTAQSFLSFRNHALHANWDKIERAEVASALAFVQELLLQHFQ